MHPLLADANTQIASQAWENGALNMVMLPRQRMGACCCKARWMSMSVPSSLWTLAEQVGTPSRDRATA